MNKNTYQFHLMTKKLTPVPYIFQSSWEEIFDLWIDTQNNRRYTNHSYWKDGVLNCRVVLLIFMGALLLWTLVLTLTFILLWCHHPVLMYSINMTLPHVELGISLSCFLPFVHGCTPLLYSLQVMATNTETRGDNPCKVTTSFWRWG